MLKTYWFSGIKKPPLREAKTQMMKKKLFRIEFLLQR